MRIANIIPVGADPDEYAPPPELIGPGNTFEGVPSGFQIHPGNAVDLMLMGLATVEAVMQAEVDGFNAAVINTVLDYGIGAARAAARIPVVGAGQAGFLMAAAVGHRFSLVSIWPSSMRPLHETQLREYGLSARCTSMRFVTTEPELGSAADEDGFYVGLRTRRQDMIDRIVAEIDAAVRDEGADAIVLGCTCMSIATPDLQQRTTVPVIDPLAAAYLQAESLARLGIAQSPAAFVAPPAERRSTYGAAVQAVAAALPDGSGDDTSCEVCILSDDDEADCRDAAVAALDVNSEG
jgi:allantoin racemase